jgi:hypothetical protein
LVAEAPERRFEVSFSLHGAFSARRHATLQGFLRELEPATALRAR